jgi:hypothetical protein
MWFYPLNQFYDTRVGLCPQFEKQCFSNGLTWFGRMGAGCHTKNEEEVTHLFCSFSKCTALGMKESLVFQAVVSTMGLK